MILLQLHETTLWWNVLEALINSPKENFNSPSRKKWWWLWLEIQCLPVRFSPQISSNFDLSFSAKKVLRIAIFHLHHKPLLTNTKIDLINFDHSNTWFCDFFFEFLNNYLQNWDKIVQTWILFSKVRFLVTLVCRLSNCFQQKKWQACRRISCKIYTYSFFKGATSSSHMWGWKKCECALTCGEA